jgi:ABC-type Na+ efflux pump permease subunit
MTHGAGTLDLPGGANITTAASDVGEFYSTASNTVTCVNYTKATGQAVIAGEGKQTIYVPANAMNPTESNGCAAITAVETTSGRPDMQVLDFDKDADEHAQFTVAFPKSWNLGTITYQVFWSGLAATTGVTWALQGVGMGDNETINVVYGTAITVDDDAQSAVEELLVSAESTAVTIAGTPADDDLTYFRIYRDVSAGNDDMAGDARLHGVKIFFTTDALNDD